MNELLKQFDNLAHKDQRAIATKALRAGALIERQAISDAAPVKDTTGGILPDGALKNDIGIHSKQSDGIPTLTVGPGKFTRGPARWVEYGHRLIRGGRSRFNLLGGNIGPGHEIGFVPAYPFIRPAFESSLHAVNEAIEKTFKEEVAKAVKKG